MPTIRYQIRNEYGLASPELYHSADKDDPEAILEGVAMAGLVGVLRQVGDLAEFAAEIFHDLHEEVMATAARGHGMMLRVQQLEAEFPSVENALLSQTGHTIFSDNAGIDLHTNLQMDQNLITTGDMPRFILDSYEECRGPPRLFTLDKFDVAGAGACLKRYSDPSFFKINLASSDKMEIEVQREKKARKTKKRGPRWRNGETLESLLMPQNDSNLQLVNSDGVSKAAPTRRVTLKHRHVNDVNRSTRRSYMKSLLEVPLPEEKVLSKTSKSQPDQKMKSIVLVESANSSISRERSPSHSPLKQEVLVLPANKLDEQSINDEELLEAFSEPTGDVPSGKDVLTEVDNELARNTNGYHLYDEENNLLKGLLTNAKYRTGGGPDGYMSDDIVSEMENFMDALNTMESDLETDSEGRDKLDPAVLNVKSQVMDYESNEGQQELQIHSPESVPIQNALGSLANFVNRSVSSSSSDTVGDVSDAQPPQPNIVHFTMLAGSELCADEIHDSTSEAMPRNREVIEGKASQGIISDRTYSDLELNGKTSMPELREASYSSNVTDPTSNLLHLYSEESFDEARSVTTDQDKILPDHVGGTSEVPKHLPDNSPCTSENLEISTQVFGEVKYSRSAEELDYPSDALLDKNDVACPPLEGIDVFESTGPEDYAEDLTLEDAADMSGISNNLLQTQEKCILDKVPHCLEDPMVPTTVETKEPANETEPEEAHSLEGVPETVIAFSKDHISSCLPSDSVIAEMPNVGTAGDLTFSPRTSDLKDAYCSVESNTLPSKMPPVEPNHLTDTEEVVQSQIMELEESTSLSFGERSLLDERSQQCDLDFENIDGPMHYPWNLSFGSDDAAVEADSDSHGPYSCPPEASGLHAQHQQDIAAGVTLLKQNNLEINEMSSVEDISTTPSGSTMNIFSPPEKEDQQMLTPKVSSYELPDEDSVDAISEPLDDAYSSVPSVHAQRDLSLAKNEADTHFLKVEDVLDSLAASQCSNEIIEEVIPLYDHLPPDPAIIVEKASKVEAGNGTHIVSSLEGVQHHDLSGIQLESAPLAKKNDISINPTDFNSRSSEPDEERDSHAIGSAPLAKQNDISINLIDFNSRSSEPDDERDSLAISSNNELDKLLLPISNMDISNQLEPEDSAAECTSEVPSTSVALDISAAALPSLPEDCLEQSGLGRQLEQKDTNPECTSEAPATSLAVDISAAAFSSLPEDSLKQSDIDRQLEQEDTDPECTSAVPATSLAVDISAAAFSSLPEDSLKQSDIDRQLEREDTDPEHAYEVPATSLALNISAAASPVPPSLALDISAAAFSSLPEDSLEQSDIGRQLEQEDTDPEHTSEVPATSLALNISAAASLSPPCFGLVPSEASFEQSVGPHVGKSVSIVPSESIGNTPSLPPLPPLEWRMGKLKMGSVTSDGKSNLLLAELNLLPEPLTQVGKHQQGIPSSGFQIFEPASSSSSLPAVEGENTQHDSFNLGVRRQQPLRLADLPPIPDGSTRRLDCKNLRSHDVLGEGIPQPSHLFAPPIPTLSDTVALPKSLVVQPNLDDGRHQLDQLLPEAASERGDLVRPTDTFLSVSNPGVEKHHYLHGVYGSENMQLMNLPMPQQYGEPKLYQHDFLYLQGNPYAAYDMTFPATEGEKPNGKLCSIRNRPRDPLIEAVASHDKSTLRKVSEMARPPTKPKEDERNTFLEQIKNKSFSLKPTVATKPNIKGPLTNIKVAAILEKANAIRQAFVGSDDDDDDEDRWSHT